MKSLIITMAIAAIAAQSQAVIVVNGVAGEDLDGVSPFETLQAAAVFRPIQ